MRIIRISMVFLAVIAIGFVPATAQFGRNKMQYQKFEWKFIQSKHFDVYYHQGGEYLANYAAVSAEQALQKIEKSFKYRIQQRVPLVIYSSHIEFQQTNTISSLLPEGVGGVTELFKNRVVLPFEGNWEQYRHVIHHELVHAVLNDMFYGGSVQSIISNNIRTEIPIWMNEGLAEFESLDGYNTETDMFMRDITLSEYLPQLSQLNGYIAYRGGQAFYWYIADKYGRERVGELINRLRSSPSLDAAFRGAFKMSFEDFNEQWMKDMKKKYWPDIARYEDVADFAAQRLTDHKKDGNYYNTSPAISPNGEKMAFISDRDNLFSVFVMDLKTKKVRKIVNGQRSIDFEELNILTPGLSWNPEGTKVAISAKAGNETALFIVNAETGDDEKISLGFKTMASVDWSPDGRFIVFGATVNEQPDLYLYEVKTSAVTKLTDDIFTDLKPTWSPDGKTVYFISDRDTNLDGAKFNSSNFKMWEYNPDRTDIYALTVATKEIHRLTFDPDFKKTSLVVSPDNTKLLYVSDKSGISNIYELQLSGGAISPKTNSLTGITQLSLSRDGSKLLFSSQTRAGFDLFLLRFPFEKTLGKEPDLTDFRKREVEREDLLKKARAKVEQKTADTLQGIGAFDFDFSRQKAVTVNPDAQTIDITDAGGGITDKFTPQDYKINFSTDVILANASYNTFFGVLGQTQMLFSDMLGDHQIYFVANLLSNLNNSDFSITYGYLPGLIDYEFGGFHVARFIQDSVGLYHRYRYFGASAKAYLPLSTFSRFEYGISWLNTADENIDIPTEASVYKMHFTPELRYVHDDALFGTYAPVKGSRYYFGATGVPKLSDDGYGFMTLTGDYRRYFALSDYISFVTRFAGGASFGPNPQNFFIGGTDNWINRTFSGNMLPYRKPEDLLWSTAGYPLRGFDINERNGSKYFMTNMELRFPLFRALLPGPVPILFQAIQGSFFFDMGSAWNDTFVATTQDSDGNTIPKDLLMSVGLGIRTYVMGFPLRLDIAWSNYYYSFSQPKYLFSLGYDF